MRQTLVSVLALTCILLSGANRGMAEIQRKASSSIAIAVLDILGPDTALKPSQLQSITDWVRDAAQRLVPNANVFTRENVQQLLEDNDQELARCVGDCEVETGRLLGADYIVTGVVTRFASLYVLTLKLHDTHNGRFLGAETAKARAIETLVEEISPAAQRLFARIGGRTRTGKERLRPAPPQPSHPGSGDWGRDDLPPVAPERGVLRVEGKPRGARVEVNGPSEFGVEGFVASSLPFGPEEVPAGEYRVSVSAPDRDTEEQTVRVYADRTEVVRVDLQRSKGRVETSGSPAGAKVELWCARGFHRVFGLGGKLTVPRGGCRVEVSRDGYVPFTKALEVGGGETEALRVTLHELPPATDRDATSDQEWCGPGGTESWARQMFDLAARFKSQGRVDRALGTYTELADKCAASQAGARALSEMAVANATMGRCDAALARLVSSGLLFVGLGDIERAVGAHLEYVSLFSDEKDACGLPDAAFYLASLEKRRETPDGLRRAHDHYLSFVRDYQHDRRMRASVVEAYARAGAALKEIDKGKHRADANTLFAKAVQTFNRLSPEEQAGPALHPTAMALFETAEYFFDDYAAVEILATDPRGLKRVLTKKAELFMETEKHYDKVLALKSPGWAAGAMFRQGLLYFDFAESLMNAPVPEELPADLQAEYVRALEDFAAPVQRKSVVAFQVALAYARKNGVYNKWSKQSAFYASKVNPDQFPLAGDPYVDVHHFSDLFGRETSDGARARRAFHAREYRLARWIYEDRLLGLGPSEPATGFRSSPKASGAWNNLGLVYWNLEMISKAVRAFRTAVELDGANLEARLNLGAIHLLFADYERSSEHYRYVVNKRPDDIEALIGLGGALLGLAQHSDAVEFYGRALALDPSKVELLLRIAQILENHVNDPVQAISAYERYIEAKGLPGSHALVEKVRALKASTK